MPKALTPQQFLTEVMNNPKESAARRLRAAIALMKTDDGSKKGGRVKAAQTVADSDRFKPSSAPRLTVVNGGS